MNIKSISYGFTKNLGNYQSERLDITIEIQPDDDVAEKVRELKKFVHDSLNKIEEADAGQDLF